MKRADILLRFEELISECKKTPPHELDNQVGFTLDMISICEIKAGVKSTDHLNIRNERIEKYFGWSGDFRRFIVYNQDLTYNHDFSKFVYKSIAPFEPKERLIKHLHYILDCMHQHKFDHLLTLD